MMKELPLTREDFEAIVKNAATRAGVEFNEDTVVAAINYFHSLERDTCFYDPEVLWQYLRRAYSSQMTYDWTTEIRHKREADKAARQQASQTTESPLAIVDTAPNH